MKNERWMKSISIFLTLFVSISSYAHKEKWDDHKEDWTSLMLAIYNFDNQKTVDIISSGVDVTIRTGK